jgi:hypothetical protein
VFSKGTSIGSKTLIPLGGQIEPISITGASAAAKKAQKKAKKNIISETINSIMPYLKPNCTIFVCAPSNVDSRTTSRHQTNIHVITEHKPKTVDSRPPE